MVRVLWRDAVARGPEMRLCCAEVARKSVMCRQAGRSGREFSDQPGQLRIQVQGDSAGNLQHPLPSGQG